MIDIDADRLAEIRAQVASGPESWALGEMRWGRTARELLYALDAANAEVERQKEAGKALYDLCQEQSRWMDIAGKVMGPDEWSAVAALDRVRALPDDWDRFAERLADPGVNRTSEGRGYGLAQAAAGLRAALDGEAKGEGT